MPDIEKWKQKIIAVSGFGAEIVSALFVWVFWSPVMLLVALAHLGLYQFYAGDASDFKWLKG